MNQQSMIDTINSVFGGMGVGQIQIGNKVLNIPKPKSSKTLKGFGDTIKVGDVVYATSDGFVDGPVKIEFIKADDNDPCLRWINPEGSLVSANYKGPGTNANTTWRREFKKADKETTKKLNDALKFWELKVKLLVDFNTSKSNGSYYRGSCFIPACWIAWVGDLQEAFKTYPSPYGLLKKKHIVSWVKSKMYCRDGSKKSVDIPNDFPVKL